MKVIMSWLFKYPIVTVTWLNFNHAQLNSKNGLYAKKMKLPQMNFFLKKIHVPISLFYLAKF